MGDFHGNQYVGESTTGYTYDHLLSDVAALAEELGRAPTTQDAEADERFPSIVTIYWAVEEDWPTTLRDAGVIPTKLQQRSAATDRRERILEDLRESNEVTGGDHLTTRQYDAVGSFATSSVKQRFGSWTRACDAAGIEPGTKHGVPCVGPRGSDLDSRLEWLTATFLDDCGIKYVVHPKVGDSSYTADFYLRKQALWVEVDGYAGGKRPNAVAFGRKLALYDAMGVEYVIVHSSDELERELRVRGVSLRD
jgi:hypothetical protein